MAVLVEALSVILLRARIAESYPGGWEGFVSDCPNQTLCADADIARVGFMMPADVEAFVKRIELKGLVFQRGGNAVDLVVVDQITGPTMPCSWIECGQMEVDGHRLAVCQLVGSTDCNIAMPVGWQYEDSLSAEHLYIPTGAEKETMRFLRHEDGKDVCQDLWTGKVWYTGRTTPPDSLRKIYEETAESLMPYIEFDDCEQKDCSTPDAQSLIRGAIAKLSFVVEHQRDAYGAYWFMGMAYAALKEHEASYRAFQRARQIVPDQRDVIRQLVSSCLETKRNEEAITLARYIVSLHPENAGLVANLGYALFMAKRLDEALGTVRQALQMAPNDVITMALLEKIETAWSAQRPPC